MKKNRKEKTMIPFVVMKDGSRHRVIREDGKYLYCTDIVLRHSNPMIDHIEEAPPEAETEAPPEAETEAPKTEETEQNEAEQNGEE